MTRRIEVGLTTHSESAGCITFEEAKVPDEMLELAIDSTIRQVSKCFHDDLYRKIGISGSRAEKVAKALKIHGKSKQSVSMSSASVSHDITAPKMLGRALQNRFTDIRKLMRFSQIQIYYVVIYLETSSCWWIVLTMGRLIYMT